MEAHIHTFVDGRAVRVMEISHTETSYGRGEGPRKRSLHFEIAPAVLAKKNLSQVPGIVSLNNRYWASLPEAKQREIYGVYVDFQPKHDEAHRMEDRERIVAEAAQRLIELHPVEEVYRWLKQNTNYFYIPPLLQEYAPRDPNSRAVEITRDQTYIRDDYIYLIAFTVILKTLFPIWGEMLMHIGPTVGARFKEQEVFRSVRNSPLYDSIPVKKLHTYIHLCSRKDADNDRNRLDGISPEDWSYHLMCRICVRLLCSADLTDEVNQIGSVFGRVCQGGQSTPTDGRQVKTKDLEGAGNDDRGGLTPHEIYSQKSNLTPGDMAEIDATTLKWRQHVATVDITVPEKMLEECIATASVLEHHPFHRCQITLMKWVFSASIQPDTFDLIQTDTNKKLALLAGCAEAILRHRGHHWLALLVSSHYNPTGANALQITTCDTNMQISPDLRNRLERVFPLARNARSNGRRSSVTTTCSAEIEINELANLIRDNPWIMTASLHHISNTTGEDGRRLRSRSDIKALLGELFIEIGSRAWRV